MTYYVYDAQGNYKRSYTLDKVSTLSASSARTVIGDDSRVKDYSKSGICRINAAISISTGFVVDSHTIATAAHCVYDIENAGRPTVTSKRNVSTIRFYKTDGSIALTLNSSDVKEVHIPKLYYDTNRVSPKSLYDYALISVNVDLSDYACFNLGAPLDSLKNMNTTLYCTGFPGDLNNATIPYTGTGTISKMDSQIITHTVDTFQGDSGAPTYIETTYKGKTYDTVIGILSGENSVNYSVRITTDVLHFYKNNPQI